MKTAAHIGLLFCVVGLIHGQQAQAPALPPQNVGFSPLTAEGLISLCKDADANLPSDANPPSLTGMTCLSYIGGFRDGFGVAMAKFNHEKQSLFCTPPEVTNAQIAKVVVKYGADHPNQLWTGAALFTALALKDGYPCTQ